MTNVVLFLGENETPHPYVVGLCEKLETASLSEEERVTLVAFCVFKCLIGCRNPSTCDCMTALAEIERKLGITDEERRLALSQITPVTIRADLPERRRSGFSGNVPLTIGYGRGCGHIKQE